MKKELTLNELREYREFIINYKSTSKMVDELKNLLAFYYWTTKDFGQWLNAVTLFCNKTLQGKCSWVQFKHPNNAAKKFLKTVLDYQESVLK